MRLFHYISYFTLGICYLLLFVVLYWLLYPYKIVEWKYKVNPILTKTVMHGDFVQYRSAYCKYINIQPEITVVFKNGILFYTPSTTGSTKSGCYDSIVSVPIPPELPKTTYRLTLIYKYQVNPLRTETYIRETEEFTIIK